MSSMSRSSGRASTTGPHSQTDGSQWDRLFAAGDTFKVGSIDARVLFSPGHTLASITYVIGDAAFVHDTIFMPDCGTARADFPGGSAAHLVGLDPGDPRAARRDPAVHRPRLPAGRAQPAMGKHGRRAEAPATRISPAWTRRASSRCARRATAPCRCRSSSCMRCRSTSAAAACRSLRTTAGAI